jgi:hypothetical protein
MGVSIWTKPRNWQYNSKKDPNWTVEAINEAMKGEKADYILTNEIRYIFVILLLGLTIWKINFYNDLYQRDDRLADLLFSKDSE